MDCSNNVQQGLPHLDQMDWSIQDGGSPPPLHRGVEGGGKPPKFSSQLFFNRAVVFKRLKFNPTGPLQLCLWLAGIIYPNCMAWFNLVLHIVHLRSKSQLKYKKKWVFAGDSNWYFYYTVFTSVLWKKFERTGNPDLQPKPYLVKNFDVLFLKV